MSHVLARLSGHGVTLVPWWPYGFERSADAPGVVTVIQGAGEATRTAAVDVTDARTVEHVVEVLPGPGEKVWRIETLHYSVIWPDDFAIESSPTGDSTPSTCGGRTSRSSTRRARWPATASRRSSSWRGPARPCCPSGRTPGWSRWTSPTGTKGRAGASPTTWCPSAAVTRSSSPPRRSRPTPS
ncbi:hypothetical protein ACFQ0B_39710 [Nonomuraea thailandensis]